MFLREAPTETLKSLKGALKSPKETITVKHEDLGFDLTDQGVIKIGDIEAPATEMAISAFGNYFDVPSKFLQRVDEDLQEYILAHLAQVDPVSDCAVVLEDEDEVQMVRDPSLKYIDPRRLVDIASKIISPEALVVDWYRTDSEFRFDTIVPEDFKKGVGGDRRTGDITRGGVRIGHDIKHNLAPWVQPYTYRLICTNGMETCDPGLKVDARGSSVEDVLEEFERKADEAFRRVEGDIKSLYGLRKEKVDNPERVLLRVAEEAGLPDRTIVTLTERMPAYLDEEGDASMFTIANLITNTANDPTIRNKAGVRRRLEQIGGAIVTEHAERCRLCSSKLT
jgi:hypothetical protein